MNNLRLTINKHNFPKDTRGGYSRTLISASFRFYKIFLSGINKFLRKRCALVYCGETKKSTPNLASGYSLVELMIAVTLFSLVAVVSISALISVNDANKKAQSMRAIIDNLNFAVENMARNLRVGSNYYCGESLAFHAPADCSLSGGSAISFRDYNNNWVVYRLNSLSQIEKSVNSGAYLPLTPYNASVSLQPLAIDYLRFYVSGSPSGDGLQPRVVVVIQGTAIYNVKIQTKFQLQTSVSQRKIDS